MVRLTVPQERPVIAAFLDRHPAKSLRLGALDWSYYDSGGGGPVVLMLGGGQGDGSVFFRQFEAFGGRARLISPTCPGDPDPAAAVAALVAFLDRLGVERPHVVGSSLGGYLALALAHQAPARVDRLLVASAFADCTAEKAGFPTPEAVQALAAETLKAGALAKLEARAASAAHVMLNAALKTAIARQPADVLKRPTLPLLAPPPLPPLDLAPAPLALLHSQAA